MASRWGEYIELTVFGESHGTGVGILVDNLPAGIRIDEEQIQAFLSRRAPGKTPWSSPRKEEDKIEVLSGVYEDYTTGAPLCLFIRNKDQRSKDYSQMKSIARPGHADYTGHLRYRGYNDPRGGGHFSGRLTAGIVAFGAIAKEVLAKEGIFVSARIQSIGGIEDTSSVSFPESGEKLFALADKNFPVLDDKVAEKMIALIENRRMVKDSVGGIIEFFAWGLEAGIGSPIFSALESRLASFFFSIPAVKGVEFGAGFAVGNAFASQNNDAFEVQNDGSVKSKSNNSGGIDGGISNGMPITGRIAIKPSSSISREQKSFDFRKHENTTITVEGRHDPCIVPRALVVIEAAIATVLLDQLLLENKIQFPETKKCFDSSEVKA